MSFFEGSDSGGGGGGDIWTTQAFSFESPLKDLLDSGDYTLEDLLGEDELLQELRGMHPQLVEFFITERVVEGLVRYMIQPRPPRGLGEELGGGGGDGDGDGAKNPNLEVSEGEGDDDSEDSDAKERAQEVREAEEEEEGKGDPARWLFDRGNSSTGGLMGNAGDRYDLRYIRYPYMACEVVCCEVDGVIDALVTGTVSVPSPLVGLRDSEGEGEGRSADWERGQDESQGLETVTVGSFGEEGKEDAEDLGPSDGYEGGDGDNDGDVNAAPPVEKIQSLTLSDELTGKQEKPRGVGERITLLDLLFSVLTETPELTLDARRAGYLEKVLSVLFRLRPIAMTEYLSGRGGGNLFNSYGRNGSAPPPLMTALFRHLHSHSLMQIVQRLLMPPPMVLRRRWEKKNQDRGESPDSDADGDGNNEDGDVPNPGAVEDQDMGLGGAWPITEDDDDDDDNGAMMDDDDDDNDPSGMGGMMAVRLDWSDGTHAVELLLSRLTGEGDGGEPTGGVLPVSTSRMIDEERYEAQLDASRNASDVLVAVVQNSPLESPAVRCLTDDPILGQIVGAIRSAETEQDALFGPHESRSTTAMSVLESLVLQLGGYGAVAPEPCMPTGERTAHVEGEGDGSIQQRTGPSSLSDQRPASAEALVSHLPPLLDSLSSLLSHPSAESWTAPVQYSRVPARLLGTSRLRVVRLLESLVLLGDPSVDSALARSDSLSKCLDLFWDFPWCSMLHQSVANLLVHVLEGGDARAELQGYFLSGCNLVGRLVDSFGNMEAEEEKGDGAGAGKAGGAPSCEPEGDAVARDIASTRTTDHSSPLQAPPIEVNELGGVTRDALEATEELREGLEIVGDRETGPRYTEVMLALKTYGEGITNLHGSTSSVESERGSSIAYSSDEASCSDSDEEDKRNEGENEDAAADVNADDGGAVDEEADMILPVSEDDVDAVMEQQELAEASPVFGRGRRREGGGCWCS